MHLTRLTILILAIVARPLGAADQELDTLMQKHLQPLLQEFCWDCHDRSSALGDVELTLPVSNDVMRADRDLWLRALRQVQAGVMPPPTAAQPSAQQRTDLGKIIDHCVNSVNCQERPNPGKVTIRRLNRSEYRNTVRDLTGINYTPAKNFPGDDVGYGFDNIGDVLSLPPILFEKYLGAAEEILDAAIKLPPPAKLFEREVRGEELGNASKHGPAEGRVGLFSNGDVFLEQNLPFGGSYQLEVTAFGDQAGDEPVKMDVRVGEKKIRTIRVDNSDPKAFVVPLNLGPGRRRISMVFTNDFYQRGGGGRRKLDRNLYITHVRLSGSQRRNLRIDQDDIPATHKKLLFVTPGTDTDAKEASSQVIQRFASRAFRRPISTDELVRLTDLAQSVRSDGGSFEESIHVAFQAIMISPHFLFKIEAPRSPGADGSYPAVSDYELATRISYFLWSSMPDDPLLLHAWNGTLRREEVLREQVLRLLKDRRSVLMIDNFASQWLQLRNLSESQPDKRMFPNFDEKLKALFRRETLTFFAAVVRYDRPVTELLNGNYTYLNETLAGFYGVSGIKGDAFQYVKFTDPRRGGLLTQGAVLTVTSNPTRTSPVKRGKWILENILGTPPPPAPADVPELERAKLSGNLRERMTQHRADPACAACHRLMDPLGFALENYDPIGQWRTHDQGTEIDPSGTLPDGLSFSGPQQLRKILSENRRDQFVRCLTEKMLTFALGRGLEYYDRCAVDKIVQRLAAKDYRFSELILAIVESDPFQKQGMRHD